MLCAICLLRHLRDRPPGRQSTREHSEEEIHIHVLCGKKYMGKYYSIESRNYFIDYRIVSIFWWLFHTINKNDQMKAENITI